MRALSLLLLVLALVGNTQADESGYLDVGVVVFDPGIPEDESTHSALEIFPRIREAEAQYLPVTLRRELVDSGEWGVVRVVPEAGPLSELTVEARMLESSGIRQRIQFTVRDATGRLWLSSQYALEFSDTAITASGIEEPYRNMYQQVAADLLSFRRGLDARSLSEIRQVALMRYAYSLSPEAFADYLATDATGRHQLQRLPAQGDSMIERVKRIRNQEYLFIDNVDEQYGELHDDMASTYRLWLQYDREQSLYSEDYEVRAASRDKQGPRGSFSAMQQSYNAYRNFRIQEQDLDELALGFNNELEPTIVETSGRVFRLTGTLDSQYTEWRGILREIFAIETGFPVNSSATKNFSDPNE
ncbi:MAG: hypothetical protein HOH70_04900 [Halieaceae bacterium]|nr:hypothetical protein [Halieaceae bacterium]